MQTPTLASSLRSLRDNGIAEAITALVSEIVQANKLAVNKENKISQLAVTAQFEARLRTLKKSLSFDAAADEVPTFSFDEPAPTKSARPPAPPTRAASKTPDVVTAGGVMLLILVAWLMGFISLLMGLVMLVAFAYFANTKSKSA
jgi:hypothetical protein